MGAVQSRPERGNTRRKGARRRAQYTRHQPRHTRKTKQTGGEERRGATSRPTPTDGYASSIATPICTKGIGSHRFSAGCGHYWRQHRRFALVLVRFTSHRATPAIRPPLNTLNAASRIIQGIKKKKRMPTLPKAKHCLRTLPIIPPQEDYVTYRHDQQQRRKPEPNEIIVIQQYTYLHGSGIDVGLKGLVGVREVGERVGSVRVRGEGGREDEPSGGGGSCGGLLRRRHRQSITRKKKVNLRLIFRGKLDFQQPWRVGAGVFFQTKTCKAHEEYYLRYKNWM